MKNLRRGSRSRTGIKKRSTAVLQPLLTLKSNTMKNTMQRYGLLGNLQILQEKTHVI